MPEATVLIPTYNHGPTLFRSVRSVLDQTIEDLELFIVGDGVPDVTREVVAALMEADRRVRFFDNPKGPRHGEIHRHAALAHARGAIVCYLCDDDLWLPDHLETMRTLLQDADFAHTLPLYIRPDGILGGVWTIDLALPADRELLMSGHNRIPLSCAGHTLSMYRQLPYVWRTTPPETFTDLYMFQQFIATPGCRFSSGSWPTALHFPSPDRLDATIDERVAELDLWTPRLGDPSWRAAFVAEVMDSVVRDRAQHVVALRSSAEQLAELHRVVQHRDQQLARIYGSRMWRLYDRLLRLPLVGPGARLIANATSSRGTR